MTISSYTGNQINENKQHHSSDCIAVSKSCNVFQQNYNFQALSDKRACCLPFKLVILFFYLARQILIFTQRFSVAARLG
jgi:hypothetical protein